VSLTRQVVALTALLTALGVAGQAQAARRVTHADYQALLRRANAEVTRAQAPINDALAGGAFTTASLRRLILALASTNLRLGSEFAAVVPPEAAARRANTALAKAERDLGLETRTMAHRLPAKPKSLAAFLARQNPKGGVELDRAIAEVTAAGYRTRF
jgi:hypothetical protein